MSKEIVENLFWQIASPASHFRFRQLLKGSPKEEVNQLIFADDDRQITGAKIKIDVTWLLSI